jgi:uncharacterized protein (UPF0332 family)
METQFGNNQIYSNLNSIYYSTVYSADGMLLMFVCNHKMADCKIDMVQSEYM